jgi:hypothetical protein
MDPNIPVQPTPPIMPEVQTPVTQPVHSSPSTPSNKTKYILLGVLILLIMAAVGGGIYYLGVAKQKPAMQKNNNVVTATVTPVPTSVPSQTSMPSIDPAAGWKTYTNSQGEYLIKYPTDYQIITAPGATGINIVNSTTEFHLIIAYENTTLNLNDYVNQKSMCTSINSGSGVPYKLDSENSLRFEKTPCGQSGSTDIYAVHNGIAYHLTMLTQPSYNTFLPILNQVLSTFKFTNQTSQTANDPTKVVNDFYSTYAACLQKYFDALSKGTSPAPTSCPSFSTYPALSPDLISKLNQVKGADPVLCAQNVPNNIKVDNAITSGNTANTTVHTYYTSSGDNPIQVGLTLENNNWLITSITCSNGTK